MNTETGAVYRGDAAVRAAMERGEPIAPISEEVARMVEAGKLALEGGHRGPNRAERRAHRKLRGAGYTSRAPKRQKARK